jgi:hypothetical protein
MGQESDSCRTSGPRRVHLEKARIYSTNRTSIGQLRLESGPDPSTDAQQQRPSRATATFMDLFESVSLWMFGCAAHTESCYRATAATLACLIQLITEEIQQ